MGRLSRRLLRRAEPSAVPPSGMCWSGVWGLPSLQWRSSTSCSSEAEPRGRKRNLGGCAFSQVAAIFLDGRRLKPRFGLRLRSWSAGCRDTQFLARSVQTGMLKGERAIPLSGEPIMGGRQEANPGRGTREIGALEALPELPWQTKSFVVHATDRVSPAG
jgi:hypothetical protein